MPVLTYSQGHVLEYDQEILYVAQYTTRGARQHTNGIIATSPDTSSTFVCFLKMIQCGPRAEGMGALCYF
jgi:hypothetical protein